MSGAAVSGWRSTRSRPTGSTGDCAPTSSRHPAQARRCARERPPVERIARAIVDAYLARPLLRQALEAQPHLDVLWSGVPQDLGRRRERRHAYVMAWSRWFGACAVRQDEAGLVLAAEDAGYDTQMRDLWV